MYIFVVDTDSHTFGSWFVVLITHAVAVEGK